VSRNRLVAIVLGVAAVLAAGLIGASLATRDSGSETTTTGSTTGPLPTIKTTSLAEIRGIPQQGFVLGSGTAAAKPTILEYADLQCPFCAQYSTGAFPEVVERWVRPGKARLEFRGLAFLGADSQRALRFVHAAAVKDKGWDAIVLLYENQGEENSGWVTDDLVRAISKKIGLNPDEMVAAMSSTAYDAAIQRTANQAQADGVTSTPSHLVLAHGRSAFVGKGVISADAFATALEAAGAQ
jgi:protein-disulfide isomerase